MPAAVYWVGGLLIVNGSTRDLDPDAGRVHDPADAALLPGRLAARSRPRRPDLARALRPDLRVPRPADRHRGEARRARGGHGRRRRLRPRLVPLRRGLDAAGRLFHGAARDDDRAGRRDRLREDDARLPGRAAVRRLARADHDRRSRHPRPQLQALSATSSASSPRRRTSSTRACARTCASRSRRRPTRRSRPPPKPRASTT